MIHVILAKFEILLLFAVSSLILKTDFLNSVFLKYKINYEQNYQVVPFKYHVAPLEVHKSYLKKSTFSCYKNLYREYVYD